MNKKRKKKRISLNEIDANGRHVLSAWERDRGQEPFQVLSFLKQNHYIFKVEATDTHK